MRRAKTTATTIAVAFAIMASQVHAQAFKPPRDESEVKFASEGDVKIEDFKIRFVHRIPSKFMGDTDCAQLRFKVVNTTEHDLAIWKGQRNGGPDASKAVYAMEWQDAQGRQIDVHHSPIRRPMSHPRSIVAAGDAISVIANYLLYTDHLAEAAKERGFDLEWPVKCRLRLYPRAAITPLPDSPSQTLDSDKGIESKTELPDPIALSDWTTIETPPDPPLRTW